MSTPVARAFAARATGLPEDPELPLFAGAECSVASNRVDAGDQTGHHHPAERLTASSLSPPLEHPLREATPASATLSGIPPPSWENKRTLETGKALGLPGHEDPLHTAATPSLLDRAPSLPLLVAPLLLSRPDRDFGGDRDWTGARKSLVRNNIRVLIESIGIGPSRASEAREISSGDAPAPISQPQRKE
jgi:hypothetical protein